MRFASEAAAALQPALGEARLEGDDALAVTLAPGEDLAVDGPVSFVLRAGDNYGPFPPRLEQPPNGVPRLLTEDGWSRAYSLAAAVHAVRQTLERRDYCRRVPRGRARAGSKAAAGGASVGAEMQGHRPSMEDAMLLDDGMGLYAVFDGHGGAAVSRRAAELLPGFLAEALATGAPAEAALRQALARVEAAVASERSGSTACVALLDRAAGDLVLANLGDSRAVLCDASGAAVELTQDQKVTAPDETARVVEAGGYVVANRVNGVLAVSRALGDAAQKPGVLATPVLSRVQLFEADRFVIIACDGIWDVFSSAEACLLVRDELAAGPQHAVNELVRAAIEDRHSNDNCSAVLMLPGGGVAGGSSAAPLRAAAPAPAPARAPVPLLAPAPAPRRPPPAADAVPGSPAADALLREAEAIAEAEQSAAAEAVLAQLEGEQSLGDLDEEAMMDMLASP